MAQDLRSFLDVVKRSRAADFQVVGKPVDARYEITGLVAKLEKEGRKRPVLLFENVSGTSFPVITNLHASRSRLAAAINAAPDQMLPTYLRAMDKPIAPRVVKTGPVKDVVRRGAEVDLLSLPQIVHHERDAGPYVTAAISFAKDPASETWNCAYNRLMIQGRDRTSIHLTLGKHLWEFHKIAEARGEPLELVKCETSDVLVPAHDELVLEGEILPAARTPEGPFGEFTGYSLGERQREIVRYTAMTHRRDAMFQDITVAHLDHMLLSTIPMEANLYRAVRAMIPSVKAVRVPSPFTCYVSIEQRLVGQAKNAIMAVLGADLYMKRVVVVDHDVDVFDDRQVNWALATRCQPDRDITIVTHARGSDLDPSTREDGYTAKWGVDATAKPSLAGYTPRHRVPPEVWKRLDLKDFSE